MEQVLIRLLEMKRTMTDRNPWRMYRIHSASREVRFFELRDSLRRSALQASNLMEKRQDRTVTRAV